VAGHGWLISASAASHWPVTGSGAPTPPLTCDESHLGEAELINREVLTKAGTLL
jgi:hypothetical protein